MARKRHTPEEIVAKLRRVDVLVSQGKSVVNPVRSKGDTRADYHTRVARPSNTVSAETSGTRMTCAVARMRRSNGSR